MRLGYHTNGLQNHRLADALTLLHEHGYEAVAITPDCGHLDPESTNDRDLDRVAARLREFGLVPVMETGARYLLDPRKKHEPTLMTRDRAGRERRLEFYSRVAAMGARLGAGVLSFWSGIDHAPADGAVEWLLDGIRATCERVRREGLEPALEPEPGMAVETVADYRVVRAALGADAPSLTLDVGHLYAVDEGSPAEVIANCGRFVSQVHLEDMRSGVHEHLPPGRGDVAFGDVLNALRACDYSGPVCFELSRSSHAAPELLATCRSLWDRYVDRTRR